MSRGGFPMSHCDVEEPESSGIADKPCISCRAILLFIIISAQEQLKYYFSSCDAFVSVGGILNIEPAF